MKKLKITSLGITEYDSIAKTSLTKDTLLNYQTNWIS